MSAFGFPTPPRIRGSSPIGQNSSADSKGLIRLPFSSLGAERVRSLLIAARQVGAVEMDPI